MKSEDYSVQSGKELTKGKKCDSILRPLTKVKLFFLSHILKVRADIKMLKNKELRIK